MNANENQAIYQMLVRVCVWYYVEFDLASKSLIVNFDLLPGIKIQYISSESHRKCKLIWAKSKVEDCLRIGSTITILKNLLPRERNYNKRKEKLTMKQSLLKSPLYLESI